MKPASKRLSALPVSAPLLVDQATKSLIRQGRDVISFCVGEPDLPTPDAVKEAGAAAIYAGDTRYTNASGTPELKQAVCAALQRDRGLVYAPDQIAVTTGAKYAVYAAVLALCDPGDAVILPAPYWTSYLSILELAGAVSVIVPCTAETGWKLTPAALRAAVTDNTKAVILNNPNNPSGAVYTREELLALWEVICERDLYVIADEIYAGLVYDGLPFCAFAALSPDAHRRTVTVSGVSKTYAMTGWRIGYAAAEDTGIIRSIGAFLSHTTGCPSAIGQTAAVAALSGDQADAARMRGIFSRRRDRLDATLTRAGIPHTRPQGAFYMMADVRACLGGAYATDLALALAMPERAGAAATPLSAFGLPGFLRLSYTMDETRIDEGVRRMAAFFGTCRGGAL